jgi:hypothetical protein
MPRESDAWPLWERRLSAVEERQEIIEHRQMRFMKQWIASHLTSPTYGKIDKTSPTSTATSTTRPPTASRYHRILKFFPQVLGWIAEKVLTWLLPYIVPALMAGWVLLKQYGETLSQWWIAALQWLGI